MWFCIMDGKQTEIILRITIDQLLMITHKLIMLAGKPIKKGSYCQLFFCNKFLQNSCCICFVNSDERLIFTIMGQNSGIKISGEMLL